MKISHLLEMIKRLTRDFFVQKKRLYRKAKNYLIFGHNNQFLITKFFVSINL